MSSLPPLGGTRDLVINPFRFSQGSAHHLSSLPEHEGIRDLVIHPFSRFSKIQITISNMSSLPANESTLGANSMG